MASSAFDWEHSDIAIVGGGLQAGLLVLALSHHAPDKRVAVFERDVELAGNHTWCFHQDDVAKSAAAWVEPLIRHRWPGYQVNFPDRSRAIVGGYAAVTAAALAQALWREAENNERLAIHVSSDVVEIGANSVTLADGRILRASLVIDARGPERSAAGGRCGFQKFVGLELELPQLHGLQSPLLMDATVAQLDGYRFMYVLPLSTTRVLVEDTSFSLSPELDVVACRSAIEEYCQKHFAAQGQLIREERGVLPMTWAQHGDEPSASPVVAGYRGGWFHPATGYSFPAAVRFAECVATSGRPCQPWLELKHLWRAHRAQARFAERLNWMLFHAFQPHAMWHVFSRFYGLPAALIHRFYALQTSPLDRARILVGRPPKGLSLTAVLAAGRTP